MMNVLGVLAFHQIFISRTNKSNINKINQLKNESLKSDKWSPIGRGYFLNIESAIRGGIRQSLQTRPSRRRGEFWDGLSTNEI